MQFRFFIIDRGEPKIKEVNGLIFKVRNKTDTGKDNVFHL